MRNRSINSTDTSILNELTSKFSSKSSYKQYQFDNHLGSACLELDDNANIISYEEYHPFGTTSYRAGRSQTETSLKRYKYCGKERDEESGLYYYGARYYASWLCRFISTDPMRDKHQNTSPYVYCVNNPIKYIDPDGKDNVIYLVVTQSAKTHLTTEDINSIKENANKVYEDMGLNTRVVIWDKEEAFDFNYADKTDGLAVIGNADDVRNVIKGQIQEEEEYNWYFEFWTGGEVNPETSSSKSNTIAMDAVGTKKYAEKGGISIGEAGGFIITHSTGHNAGITAHSNEREGRPTEKSVRNALIMLTGDAILNNLRSTNKGARKLSDITHKDNNSLYIKMMEQRFGTNKSSDNYDSNKKEANQKEKQN